MCQTMEEKAIHLKLEILLVYMYTLKEMLMILTNMDAQPRAAVMMMAKNLPNHRCYLVRGQDAFLKETHCRTGKEMFGKEIHLSKDDEELRISFERQGDPRKALEKTL